MQKVHHLTTQKLNLISYKQWKISFPTSSKLTFAIRVYWIYGALGKQLYGMGSELCVIIDPKVLESCVPYNIWIYDGISLVLPELESCPLRSIGWRLLVIIKWKIKWMTCIEGLRSSASKNLDETELTRHNVHSAALDIYMLLHIW